MYEIIGKDGKATPIPSSDLKVGDIVKISKDNRVPADILLLWSLDEEGTVFIRTD